MTVAMMDTVRKRLQRICRLWLFALVRVRARVRTCFLIFLRDVDEFVSIVV
jgi:hypothetical protein